MPDRTFGPKPSREEWLRQYFPEGEADEEAIKEEVARHTGVDSVTGRLANMFTTGAAGAQLGAIFGPKGAVAGGLLGAGAGALLPPAEAPMTEVGATAAELLANRFLPGGGKLFSRLGRGLGVSAAVAGGGYLGSIGDKKANFVSETPWGRIAFFAGTDALSLSTAAMFPRGKTAMAEAVEALKAQTGVEIPLSFSEATGAGAALERFFLTGSGRETALGEKQAETGLKVLEKIIGEEVKDFTRSIANRSVQLRNKGYKQVLDYVAAEKKKNKVPVERTLPILDASGTPITVTEMKSPKTVTWDKFQQMYKLTFEERDAFFRAIHAKPERFIEQLVAGTGQGNVKGFFGLRALMKVLPEEDAAKLGSTFLLRTLAAKGALDSDGILRGEKFAKVLLDSIGKQRLAIVFDPDQVQALETLATVMKEVDPVKKIGGSTIPQTQRTLSYIGNKLAFGITIGGGSAGLMSGLGQAVTGALVGGTVILPLSSVMSMLLANPSTAKFLSAAAKGDMTAAMKLVRAVTSGEDLPEEPETSPLVGLFRQTRE